MVSDIPGWATLYPYQQEAAVALGQLAPGGRKLSYQGLWATTGVGKTAILLATLGYVGLPLPTLVLTKALGRHVWPRDARWVLGDDYAPGVLWGGSQRGPGVHETHGRRTYTSLDEALARHPVVVTNYEVLATRFEELAQVPFRALILDEAHEIKGGYQGLKKKRDGSPHLLRYHWVRRLSDQVRARSGYVWSATATPIIDRRRDLFAQVDVLRPSYVGSSWNFLHRYCGAYINEWGGLESSGVTTDPRANKELKDRCAKLFVSIRRSDVADQMPPITRDVRYVPNDGESFEHMGGSVETALDRAAAVKLPAVLEIAEQYLSEKLKIIIVTTRRRGAHKLAMLLTAKAFAKKLPRPARESLDVRCVTGETSMHERIAILEAYNAKPSGPCAIVATIDSLRDSVDLQQTDGVVVASYPVKPGALFQLEGRFSRLGGRPVTIYYPVAERTIDEQYKELVIDKMTDIKQLDADTQGEGGAISALTDKVDEDAILQKLRESLG
jgi:hypothetical protein